jgi:hypothetical protein
VDSLLHYNLAVMKLHSLHSQMSAKYNRITPQKQGIPEIVKAPTRVRAKRGRHLHWERLTLMLPDLKATAKGKQIISLLW